MNSNEIHELIFQYKSHSLIRSIEDDEKYINKFMSELDEGIHYGKEYADSVWNKYANDKKLSILDIGCSHGAMTAGIADHPNVSKIVGLEVEEDAVNLANGLKRLKYYPNGDKMEFIIGKAESLPFKNNSFDYIFCHTVIEHVDNIELSIAEMARCIKDNGEILISAPNYMWFMEPHLKVPMLPGFGKKTVKIIARLLNKNYCFVDTLQFVTPKKLEKTFRSNNLMYENLSLKKYYKILVRLDSKSLARKNIFLLIKVINQLKLGKLIVGIMLKTGIYPGLSYRLYKAGK